MRIADEPPAGAPEWLLTYGDLMTLLLTIFVMLVSMGELKQTDKFQGVADSLHEQFGTDSAAGLGPGELRPRNSLVASLAVAFRAQRREALGGELLPEMAARDVPVRLIQRGDRTTVGTSIPFADDSAELSPEGQVELRQLAAVFGGKPQKIEVRGHAAPPTAGDPAADDPWDLAYRRGWATMRFLVEELEIDEARIRVSTAGAYEPLRPEAGAEAAGANARVEVFLLEETASELVAGAPPIRPGNRAVQR
jgi:chemotaxis protein MotB